MGCVPLTVGMLCGQSLVLSPDTADRIAQLILAATLYLKLNIYYCACLICASVAQHLSGNAQRDLI